jgi:hypothetical protein
LIMKSRWFLLRIALLLLVLSGLVLTRANRSPDYLSFTRFRNQKFYAAFSEECDHAIATMFRGSEQQLNLRGDDPRLGPRLRRVGASSVTIRSNQVTLRVNSRVSYSISWEQDLPPNPDPRVWRLWVRADEATPIEVYSRINER